MPETWEEEDYHYPSLKYDFDLDYSTMRCVIKYIDTEFKPLLKMWRQDTPPKAIYRTL